MNYSNAEYQRLWIQKNYEKHRENQRRWHREYRAKRLATDLNFKIRHYLRNRLNCALNNKQKAGSAVTDLGCSISELKLYLESKFKPGMSWENHGQWHIDHKMPLSKFDLSNKIEFLKATHFSNLQPLWADDNYRKGNSYNE